MREGGKKTFKKNIEHIFEKGNEGDEIKKIGHISGKVNTGDEIKQAKKLLTYFKKS